MKAKKGQITVFIIIGILLLAVIGLLVYVNLTQERRELEQIPEVPYEFQPVSSFVDNCILKTSVEALKIIGKNGGYIDPVKHGFLGNQIDSTTGNAVAFPGNWVIPYWYHMSSDNKCLGRCEFAFGYPPLFKPAQNSIQQQLENYIDANLKLCLNDFKDFRQQGYIINEKENLKAELEIAKEDILVKLDYPLEITYQGSQTNIDRFYMKIPLNLGKIYELATILTHLEQMHRYIEKDTLNLIVAFSAKDKDKLPPMAASGIDFAPTLRWSKTNVKQDVQSMLTSYIQLLQVENTDNYEYRNFIGDPMKEAIYNQHMTIPSNETHDLAVKFNYNPFWPLYFDLNCNGDICEPESASNNLIALFGLQRYNFAYDLSFPVMVEIFDPYALNNQGYSFMFFLESNIRNNEVLKSEFYPLPVIRDSARTMLCDENKKNSGDITLNVKDSNGFGLDDVIVTYTCADETCRLSNTEDGLLKEKFPICLGGIVSFIKEDHLTTSKVLSTYLDEEKELDVEMLPVKTKKLKLKKKKMVKFNGNWEFRDNPLYLSKTEQALVILTRKGSLTDDPFSATADYYGNSTQDAFIDIVPGDYEINIQLLNNKPYKIPEKEECVDKGILGEECYDLPELEFNTTMPNGGVKINYTFTQEDLEAYETIVLTTIGLDFDLIPPSQRHIDDLEQINNIELYSTTYNQQGQLLPSYE